MKHRQFVLLLGFFFSLILSAENKRNQYTISNDSVSVWKSFECLNLTFEGRDARIVKPVKPLPGKPWLWRARFPDYHAEIDSALLAQGFHVAYVNTDNQFGSPKAMKVWDEFYMYIVKTYHLQAKVAIHCHSRGGLFAYNWAKKNLAKIACIYADAIVCDFKSWPAGFGESKGDAKAWQILKEEYGFQTDQEAQDYRDNPIDNLDALAKAGVPIFHTISLNDKVVPPEENSLLLVNRYVRLGGTASLSPCSSGIQKSKGHHYDIDNPKLIVDFIKYHTTERGSLNSSDYHLMQSGLQNCRIQFERYKKGRVAFLGGSITANGGWRDSVCTYLIKRFPDTEFDFVAAGIPSMGSTSGAFRLERDVLSRGEIDLLFEEAAVNDPGIGRSNKEQIRGMEGIVRHARNANPSVDIVMMHFVDPGKMESYRSGQVPEVIANHNQIADRYAIPTINLAKEVTERIDNEEFTWKHDFKNLHPSPFGQRVYAHSMIQFLENAFAGHIDEDDKIAAHPMPEKIDKAAYDKGAFIEINTIKPAKDWHIDHSWNPGDGKRTRQNFIDVPMLISEKPGSKQKIKFKGNAVGIAVAAGPDAGILEYRIDKGKWQQKDLFTRYSHIYHLPRFFVLESGLENKNHQMEIRLCEEKNKGSKGNACRIRYFLVNN